METHIERKVPSHEALRQIAFSLELMVQHNHLQQKIQVLFSYSILIYCYTLVTHSIRNNHVH